MLNILILYDIHSVHVNTTYEHLLSFQRYSKHNIYYCTASYLSNCNFDLSLFDVIIMHYCVRPCFDGLFSTEFSKAFLDYQGFKVLFIQDEYDYTELTRQWINKINYNVVFSCVPKQYIETVYPANRFPSTLFEQTLTGFVPIDHEKFNSYITPIKDRQSFIGYRGRNLPFWYGKLCQEKEYIGTRMKEFCKLHSIEVDIETEETKRIYGEGWYQFISKSKATLGTESGSNVFDDVGSIRQRIKEELQDNPSLSFEEAYEKYLKEHEDNIKMNQISPKIFESITFKTALILFEGNYSGVITPHVHYIPLKKDFSNIEDVLAKLKNNTYLQEMVDRAYEDIILSQKYSYKTFINHFESIVETNIELPHFYRKNYLPPQTFADSVKEKGLLHLETI